MGLFSYNEEGSLIKPNKSSSNYFCFPGTQKAGTPKSKRGDVNTPANNVNH